MIKKILSVFLSVLTVVALFIFNAEVNANAETTDSEIIMEVHSGRVLYEKNCREKKHIASLTKIMTAIVVIENANLSETVTVPEKCCGIEGSSVYLKPNEKLSVEDLLYGLMLRSGNDCAETLAVTLFGSIGAFAEKMNEKARELGATDTNFVNPHGLYDGENYSTAYDLALITSYGMKNGEFRKIVGTKTKTIPDASTGGNRFLKNKNKLLFNYGACVGVKTGYTKKAGRCLAAAAVKDGTELVSVVLNCGPMYEVSEKNFENAFGKYKTVTLCDAEKFAYSASIGKDQTLYGYVKDSFIYPLSESETADVSVKNFPAENIRLPVKKDQIIGRMEIYLKNQLIFSQNIYSILDVGKKFDFFEAIKNWSIFKKIK
ncbi:MAG: D-alanyl-D-alanine carboxypeptidase [Clostridia bacterium]|nr:D-alanyl-D-alanine carboxypeptidase [Clostridia bacterium]